MIPAVQQVRSRPAEVDPDDLHERNVVAMPELTQTDLVRFWSKVTRSDGCWEWQAYRDARGYGKFGVGMGCYLAHRLSHFIATGTDPGRLHVCHRCDNPPCVNPDHLFLGTARDNSHDREAKGRGNQPRGLANGRAKLSDDDVRGIRRMIRQGFTHRATADEFGVSESYVSNIISGIRRQYVEDDA